jgi:arylsulfatase A-like enzyme
LLKSSLERLAIGFAALLLTACSRGDGRAALRPSLVLITLDTVRADHLGCYGDAAAETPALDRLAREGVRFAQASSAVPLTLPSHSSLLSGLLPLHHGLRNNGSGVFPEGTATLATVLSGQGWRTGAFVGAFVLDHRFGLARGFDVYDDEIERDPNAGESLEAERPGRVVMDRALAWLSGSGETKGPARPFFLWVHLYDAHAPYTPPSPWRERHPGRPYDGEIAEVDAQVGRLMAELEHRGLAASTVVAVAADHGEGLGEHGELTHGLLLYEPTLRVPLLVRAPGVPAGQVVKTPVSLVDVAPTLAGLLGTSLPAPHLDGRDLSAALRNGGEPAPADIYAETQYPAIFGWSPLAALRRRDLKYIAAPRPELYDLSHDPGEKKSLETDTTTLKGFAARVAALEAGAVQAPRGSALDSEARARLASLGYVSGTAGSTPAARAPAPGTSSAPDPKLLVDLFQRFERAHNGLKSGQPGEAARALADLSALVAADPRNPVFRGELARAYRQRRDMDRAIPLYRQRRTPPPTPRPGTTWPPRSRRPGMPPTRRRPSKRPYTSTRDGRRRTIPSASSIWQRENRRKRGGSSRSRPPSTRATPWLSTTWATCCAASAAWTNPRPPTGGRWPSRRGTPSRSTGSAPWRWSAIGPLRHSLFLSRLSGSRRAITRSVSTRGSLIRWRERRTPPPRPTGTSLRPRAETHNLPSSAGQPSSCSPICPAAARCRSGRRKRGGDQRSPNASTTGITPWDAFFLCSFLIQRTPKEIEP